MNERIKELANCNERIQSFFETGPVQRAAIEQFAELIVQECMFVVEDAVDHREHASTYADKIKDHFGIETVDSTLRNRSTYFGNDL